MVDLGYVTIAVIRLQDYAANLSAGSGNIEKAFNREAVSTVKGLIRAALPSSLSLDWAAQAVEFTAAKAQAIMTGIAILINFDNIDFAFF